MEEKVIKYRLEADEYNNPDSVQPNFQLLNRDSFIFDYDIKDGDMRPTSLPKLNSPKRTQSRNTLFKQGISVNSLHQRSTTPAAARIDKNLVEKFCLRQAYYETKKNAFCEQER